MSLDHDTANEHERLEEALLGFFIPRFRTHGFGPSFTYRHNLRFPQCTSLDEWRRW